MLLILTLFFLIFSFVPHGYSHSLSLPMEKQKEQIDEVYCSLEFQESFSKLCELPEVQDLIDRILEKGPLSIVSNHCMSCAFEGYWSSGNRTIYVTKNPSKAAMMTTILFEMHNAANDAELAYYDSLAYHKQIDRKAYIRAVEYWEYKNAKATTTILNKGIALGIFPKECYWPIQENFAAHFRDQKFSGHSAHIGSMYDSLI